MPEQRTPKLAELLKQRTPKLLNTGIPECRRSLNVFAYVPRPRSLNGKNWSTPNPMLSPSSISRRP
eukprot:12159552-Alexandrium_andersonii.AAC.1